MGMGNKKEAEVPTAPVDSWTPPLQKHMRNGHVEFSTIRVRIFYIQETDFTAKFKNGPLFPSEICKAIAEKQGLSIEGRKGFALWIIGRDIEIQLRSSQDVFKVVQNWHRWVEKYTHYADAKNADHPINKHWFVFRREALWPRTASLEYEDHVLNLLYGEATHNIINSKYPCTVDDIVNLAGLQLQSRGDYNPNFHKDDYLMKQDRWHYLVPLLLRKKIKTKAWVDKIMDAYKRQKGKTTDSAKKRYVEYIRKWPFYGNSFFPCCQFLPPEGFFEMRTQKYSFGVGTEGVTLINNEKNDLLFFEKWCNLKFKFEDDHIQIAQSINNGGKIKKLTIISPQVLVIENLIARAVHISSADDVPDKERVLIVSDRKVESGSEVSSTLNKRQRKKSQKDSIRFSKARDERVQKAMDYVPHVPGKNGYAAVVNPPH